MISMRIDALTNSRPKITFKLLAGAAFCGFGSRNLIKARSRAGCHRPGDGRSHSSGILETEIANEKKLVGTK